jgi:hypothetical protein
MFGADSTATRRSQTCGKGEIEAGDEQGLTQITAMSGRAPTVVVPTHLLLLVSGPVALLGVGQPLRMTW